MTGPRSQLRILHRLLISGEMNHAPVSEDESTGRPRFTGRSRHPRVATLNTSSAETTGWPAISGVLAVWISRANSDGVVSVPETGVPVVEETAPRDLSRTPV